MKAFHNDPKIKEKYLSRVLAHAKADELIKGKYWQNGKGCAVGCTIHSSDHSEFEKQLGIPEWLARLEDVIFENLSNERAKVWPIQFLEAINLGSDLDKIKTPFLIFILEKNLEYLDQVAFDEKNFPEGKAALEKSRAAIHQTIEAHKENDEVKLAAAESAAEFAAEFAAWSAAWSAARFAARFAAWSAAGSAWSAAESAARFAAWSAARSATGSAARSAAGSAARSAATESYADRLLKMMAECN